MISIPVYRYFSKTATSTHLDFDYDGPSMKTTVPGPHSQVTHKHTEILNRTKNNIFTNVIVKIFMSAGSLETAGRYPSEFILYLYLSNHFYLSHTSPAILFILSVLSITLPLCPNRAHKSATPATHLLAIRHTCTEFTCSQPQCFGHRFTCQIMLCVTHTFLAFFLSSLNYY